jgi:hypothetical protein
MAAPTGIFNALDNGMSPDNTPGTNTTNLKALVSSLLNPTGPTNGTGGTIEFPMIGSAGSPGTYKFNDTITIGPNPASIIFRGTTAGSGTNPGPPANPTPVPVLQQTVAKDLFVIDNNPGGSADISGILFEDLSIQFSEGLTAGAAVHVTGGSNCVRLHRVTLIDCPVGYLLDWSLSCSMIDSQIYNSSNPGTPLILGESGGLQSAIETFIAGCTFLNAGGAAQNLGTAVQIYGCEHLRMINTRLEAYGQGIVIEAVAGTGNVRKLYFGNVSCFPYQSSASTTGAAVLIKVRGGNNISQVVFAECELSAPDSGTAYTGPGISLDAGTNASDVLDQVRFVSCYSCSWQGAGMNIIGGTNIEILGGYYSCNNQSQSTSFSNSGIAITGPASGVRITGAACNNSVTIADNGEPQNKYQKYGIYVSNGAASVRINACDLTGNLTNSLVVDGSQAQGAPSDIFVGHTDCTGVSAAVDVILPVGSLEIFDCPGYNDQRPILNANNAPALGTPLSASTCSTPYFGPSAVTFSGSAALSVSVTGTIFTMSFGDFYLSRPTDPVGFGAQPSVFAWVGK